MADKEKKEPQVVTAYKCSACDAISAEVNESRLYECGSCGTIFNSENSADGEGHRCPDCNKFAGKLGDESCSECDEGPVEEIEAYEDPDTGELVEVEDAEEEKQEPEKPKARAPEIITAKDLLLTGMLGSTAPDWVADDELVEMVYAQNVIVGEDERIFCFKTDSGKGCAVVTRAKPTAPEKVYSKLGEQDRVEFLDNLSDAMDRAVDIMMELRAQRKAQKEAKR